MVAHFALTLCPSWLKCWTIKSWVTVSRLLESIPRSTTLWRCSLSTQALGSLAPAVRRRWKQKPGDVLVWRSFRLQKHRTYFVLLRQLGSCPFFPVLFVVRKDNDTPRPCWWFHSWDQPISSVGNHERSILGLRPRFPQLAPKAHHEMPVLKNHSSDQNEVSDVDANCNWMIHFYIPT